MNIKEIRKSLLYITLTGIFFSVLLFSVTLLPRNASPVLNLRNNLPDLQTNLRGSHAYKDEFEVVAEDFIYEDQTPLVLGAYDDPELKYNKTLIEMPLVRMDYYYGKHLNATAGVNEMNSIPVLTPGSRVSVIGNGYLTMSRSRGYVMPSISMFGSGVCWSVSALGTLMDEANKTFMQKYGEPLFIFYPGDRTPHSHAYSTYRISNYGYGYTVVKYPGGGTDYRFTVNPRLSSYPQFKDFKLKIVMVSSTDHPNAYNGESIGGYIKTNKDY
jgi:hypothetical protein